jgi:hypothetical protein
VLALVLPALVACGGNSSPKTAPASSPTSSAASAHPSFDPCDRLDPAPVARALGSALRVDRGRTGAARCALLPVKQGAPTFQLNYLWFSGGLDAAFKTIKIPAGTVTSPKVPGADSARLIVQQTPRALYISAFVQNGDLIQSLNGLALRPYDAGRMRRAALVLLDQLSAHAPAS